LNKPDTEFSPDICIYLTLINAGVFERYKDSDICFSKFDGITVSSHVKCNKPQLEIYKHLLEGGSSMCDKWLLNSKRIIAMVFDDR